MNKGKKILILFFLLFSLKSFGQSNQIVFGQLDLNDGLSQNSVVSIAQDSLGYIWFATQDGLNRYDGHEFYHYEKLFWDITREHKTQLGQLMIDQKGVLWILPQTGIPERYNTALDTFEVLFELKNINCFFQNKNGDYFFGTKDQGLLMWDGKGNDFNQILEKGHVSMGMIDDQNEMSLIVDGKILSSTDFKTFVTTRFENAEGISISPRITTLMKDESGQIWAGSFGQGLFVKEKNKKYFSTFQAKGQNDLTQTKILSLLQDSQGRLWIGTYGQGVFLWNPRSNLLQQFQTEKQNPNAISYNDILNIIEDQNGVIWFGTDGGGVSFYDEYLSKFNGFTNNQVPPNIQIDVVRSLLVDVDGNTWIGTSGKGLTFYDSQNLDQTWYTYTSQNSNLSSNRIMSLEEGLDGSLWIGTQGGGLDICDPVTKEIQNIGVDILSDHTIWDIHQDQENRHWLGTRNAGLIELDEKKQLLNQYRYQEGFVGNQIAENNIRCIINGATKDELWLGFQDRGVCHFDKKANSFKTYLNPRHGSNKIKSLYLASNGILWIGTNGNGLEALDLQSKKFYHFGLEDGLPNKVIYGILSDDDGNLWLSTNRGICKFSPPKNLKNITIKPQIRIYDNFDGLQSFEFNTGAYTKDKKGHLYFGGIKGFNWFDPNSIKSNPFPPKVMLTDFLVNGNSVLTKTQKKRENKNLLKHWQNDLSFTFSSNSYSLPERNQFRYQLIGYDKKEIQAGNRHFVSYTNLAPGDYRFVIKASNYDGVWNEKGEHVDFHIAYPWYNTNWAWLLFAFLFCCALLAIFWELKRRWELNALLKQERQKALHLEEMSTFRNKLHTNITHEFRTPLTVIKGMAEELSENEKAKLLIHDNTNQLLHLVNQILDLSKLESGQLQFDYSQQKVISFLKFQIQAFDSLAVKKGLALSFDSNESELWMDIDVGKLQQVISNLIVNAIKFTPEDGEISLGVKKITNTLQIKVSDSGIGLSPEHIPHIFERFYQVDPHNNEHQGSGIGLAYVKELVELMDGNIQVESRLGFGTIFTILLPIRNVAPMDTAIFPKTVPVISQNESPVSLKEASRILIIEDNKDVAYYIETILTKYYLIDIANNGQQGIEKALQTIPDLIISDVMMPIMDGFELCNTLKNNELSAHIPIILLTAKTSLEDKKSGLQKGADAYLIKPFDKEELLIRINQMLKLRNNLQHFYSKKLSTLNKPTNLSDPFLEKLNIVINENLADENFKTPQLCQQVFYSKMQVHRKLKALTGLSTSQYLRNYRLQYAKKLLIQNHFSISEVANISGFTSLQYFSRCFKEVYNISPSEFLKSL